MGTKNILVKNYLVNEKGKLTAVVIDIKKYKKLLKLIEDNEDLHEFDRLKDEPSIPYEDFEKQLKKNGLL